MAKKVVYLGDGKWCYTEKCSQHASLIADKNRYVDAVKSKQPKRIAKAAEKLLATKEGSATYAYLRTQQIKAQLGRTPNIGLDLDGTTGDFTEGLRRYMVSTSPIKIEEEEWNSKFPDPVEYAMWQGHNAWYSSREDFLKHFQQAEKEGLYTRIPIYPQASRIIQELRHYGFNVKAVTARGAEFNHHTSAWISEHSIAVTALLNPGTEKQTVPNIDLYIDDAPHVVNQLLEHDKNVVVMNQSYNIDSIDEHPNAKRVTEWNDNMVESIFQLLEKRRKKN